MAEDRVTITADASQYFDVLSRAGAAANRFAQTGDKIGAGFLRGDRVVRTATANITQGLLTANSAADAALITFQSLERVFRIPIGALVGVAAGVAAFAAVKREIDLTTKAFDALKKEVGRPLAIEVALDPSDIAQRIESVGKATDDVVKRRDGWLQTLKKLAVAAAPGGIGAVPGLDKPFNEQISAGLKRQHDLLDAQANQELRIAVLKQKEADLGKDASEIDKARLKFETDRAKLLEGAFKPGAQQVDIFKRLLALQIGLNAAIKIQNDLEAAVLEKAKTKLGATARGFFQDVGSGQFLKDEDQRRLQEQQEQFGKDQVAEFADARARGIDLGPNAQAILREADKLAKGAKTTIQDLANTDFSNLFDLSKYDFTGLAPLNGLIISIQ
jgi:hypothetical protein